jgi:hypothetical protein
MIERIRERKRRDRGTIYTLTPILTQPKIEGIEKAASARGEREGGRERQRDR